MESPLLSSDGIMNFITVGFKSIVHAIYAVRKCNETLDNIDQSQKSCVDSQCNLGIGFYFSLISTFFWSISLILLLQLLRKSESLYKEINKGKEELKCNAEIEEGLHESHGPSI